MTYTTEYEHIWLHDDNDFMMLMASTLRRVLSPAAQGDSKTATIEHGAEE